MQFLLNQHETPIDLSLVDPNLTILQFLRSTGRVGTKEGCASGDCGACTAVVVEWKQNGESEESTQKNLDFKSINTCIGLVHSLAGKLLITVEGLEQKGVLHPVQQAMIDHHGSQCGYCTPGFIMSAYAWFVNHNSATRENINHALSGNLCRCTGYQPIIQSCQAAMDQKTEERKNNQHHYIDPYDHGNTVERLQALHKGLLGATTNISQTNFYMPQTIDEAGQLITQLSQAKIVCGGTDLVLGVTLFSQKFDHIICLQNVRELKKIVHNDVCLEVYAGVSIAQAMPVLCQFFPSMQNYLYRFASTQIRNWATLCGNIANASPIGDFAPILIVLDSQLVLRKNTLTRKIALRKYYLGYKKTVMQSGEFIQSVTIPKLSSDQRLFVHKLSKRFEDDISTVSVAVLVGQENQTLTSMVIAFGGMAEIPKRAKKLEQVLVKELVLVTLEHLKFERIEALFAMILEAIQHDFRPIDDMRASANYRISMAAQLVQRVLLQLSNNFDYQSVMDYQDNDTST